MTQKPLLRLHGAYRDDIADLVTRRPVPSRELTHIGAFLFLNHHGPQVYPRIIAACRSDRIRIVAFETVTFILEGNLAHRDSAGHESVIEAGGVQWMTAGSGLVHAEVSPASFKREGGPLEILQLWVNLPARLKMTPPRYTGVQKDSIPAIESGGVTLNLISGEWAGQSGPVQSLTGVFMTTLEVAAGGHIRFDALTGRDVFCYVVRGEAEVNGTKVPAFNLSEFGEGDVVEIRSDTGATLLFGHAEPINEPIVSHGPFVMNTVEEIHQAYADYQSGKLR